MRQNIQPGSFHLEKEKHVFSIEGLCHIIPFGLLRKTKNVDFHHMPFNEGINGIDRVVHGGGIPSPIPVGEYSNPWYMHEFQEDSLMVMHGTRFSYLYTPEHGKEEMFEVTPDYIKHNGKLVYEGPAMLGYPVGVFHRNFSPDKTVALFYANRFEGFDIDSEFNIYDVDIDTGKYKVVREGHLDQPKDLKKIF